MNMKMILLILAYQCGACAEEDKRIELYVPAMESVAMVMQEAMVLIGVILAMLTEVFADCAGGMESYQMASVSIKVSCEDHFCTLYKQHCLIPCNGRKHLLWLNDIRNSVKKPLSKFLCNVALKPSDGTRL